MSPDESCRPAGVVFHPFTNSAFGPFCPGTIMSFPVAGCFVRNGSNAVQAAPASTMMVRVRARRFIQFLLGVVERVQQLDDKDVSLFVRLRKHCLVDLDVVLHLADGDGEALTRR